MPRGATLLARGERFKNQAFSYGRAAYAIQFHPEVTAKTVDRWTTLAAHRLKDHGAQPRADQLAQIRRFDPGIRAWLGGFLSTWLTGPLAQPVAKRARAARSMAAAGSRPTLKP